MAEPCATGSAIAPRFGSRARRRSCAARRRRVTCRSALRSLVRRRQRRIAAVTLEPTHHIELRTHPIRGLGAGAVIFLIKAQHCRRNAAIFERLIELLALRNGGAP